MMPKKKFVFFLLILSLNSLAQRVVITGQFRGVWISTVKRLDYPSASGLSAEQLKKEYIQIVNYSKSLGLNAIIFQIRPAADAFYHSEYEPWSEWLTGKQGRPPQPYFDPLQFMIEQTHKQKMQFHAWINPFRAVATISHANISPEHITKTKPHWFYTYGINKYFDPGIPEVRHYIAKIIADIVRRYDVDAIHFDDYFYPYPIRNKDGKIIDIPDHKTYEKYKNGFSNIKEWRRNNINLFIKEVHDSIKAIKPYVKFGISPPGVWRNKSHDPKGSNTRGLAAYDWLYADVLTWLRNKWIDYVAPQLYWHTHNKYANYKVLLNWWTKNNYGVDLYIGLNIHGINPHKKYWNNPSEIPNEIRLALKNPQVKGFILYRYSDLVHNPLGICDTLQLNLFADTNTVAIIYPSDTSKIITQTDTARPLPPISTDIFRVRKNVSIVWNNNPENKNIIHYNIYVAEKNDTLTADKNHFFASDTTNFYRFYILKRPGIFGKKYKFAITAVSKNGKESKLSKSVRIKLNKKFLKPF